MKLNFWQILGIALLVIGGAWWLYQKNQPAPAPVTPTTPAATTPTTTTAPVTPPK